MSLLVLRVMGLVDHHVFEGKHPAKENGLQQNDF